MVYKTSEQVRQEEKAQRKLQPWSLRKKILVGVAAITVVSFSSWYAKTAMESSSAKKDEMRGQITKADTLRSLNNGELSELTGIALEKNLSGRSIVILERLRRMAQDTAGMPIPMDEFLKYLKAEAGNLDKETGEYRFDPDAFLARFEADTTYRQVKKDNPKLAEKKRKSAETGAKNAVKSAASCRVAQEWILAGKDNVLLGEIARMPN